MENLTVEQRIEKIKELAGDDIGVILNMKMESIHLNQGYDLPLIISGNTVTGINAEGIMVGDYNQ